MPTAASMKLVIHSSLSVWKANPSVLNGVQVCLTLCQVCRFRYGQTSVQSTARELLIQLLQLPQRSECAGSSQVALFLPPLLYLHHGCLMEAQKRGDEADCEWGTSMV